MHESLPPSAEPDTRSPIVHVSDLPLESVLLDDESVLGNAVRHVLAELRQPGESWAAHSSST